MTEKIPEKSYEEIREISRDITRQIILRLKEEPPINHRDIIKILVYSCYDTLDRMPFQTYEIYLKFASHSLLYLMETEFGKDWNKNLPKP
jgi:hypothetical protein